MIKTRKKVLIAMSGGVDSSVAAYLLKKQRHEVTGLHLRIFKDGEKEKRIKKIAKKIGMPLIIKDVQKEFKKKVIDYFLREYKTGRTPNPCVVCNREIKFKFLFDELNKLKADHIATGHYARLRREILNPKSLPRRQAGEILNKSEIQNTKFLYKLFEARDKTKDQSYFLYTLNQKQLAKTLFPLGNYKKEEVKKMAEKYHLTKNINKNHLHVSSADDKCRYEESRGTCFILDKWPDEFLKKNIKMKPGDIIEINGNEADINRDKVEKQGKIIGRHIGLPLYTIGQRRNIRVGGTGPYYVAAKDFRKNELIVVRGFNNPMLYKKELLLGSPASNWKPDFQVNWILGEPKFPLRAKVCIRYHHPAIHATIKKAKSYKLEARSCLVEFSKPQRAVTPGQAAVVYSEKGEVLGGGIII